MARSFRYDPDDAPAPRGQRQQDRNKRDARKAQFATPVPVTRTLRDARTLRDE